MTHSIATNDHSPPHRRTRGRPHHSRWFGCGPPVDTDPEGPRAMQQDRSSGFACSRLSMWSRR